MELKPPPSDSKIEKSVIGRFLLNDGSFDLMSDIIDSGEYFYDPFMADIFCSMKELRANGSEIDIISVYQSLKRLGRDIKPIQIMSLTNDASFSSDIKTHCIILKELYIRREQIKIARGMMKEAYSLDKDVFDSLFKAETDIFGLSIGNDSRKITPLSEDIKESLERIETIYKSDGKLTGVTSGFKSLDANTNGFQGGDMYIIAARPGLGKTAMALNIAINAAEQGHTTALFSLEMSKIELLNRMYSRISNVPLYNIQRGLLDDDRWAYLTDSAMKLGDMPLFIDDTASLTIAALKSKCRMLKSTKGLELVIIDYLQLMSLDNTRNMNREQEVSTISRNLKILSKDLNVPVIALSQLSRDVEKRGDVPKLSDLRNSGSLEQDASFVGFIHRPNEEEIADDASLSNIANFKIAKNRNGVLDNIIFSIDLSIQKWSDYESNEF